jgi:hypothetical protein
MKKVLFALALGLGILFTSCQDKIFNIAVVSDDGRVIADIHGIIDDGQTNLRLGGINVTYSKDGKVITVQTDTSGYYAIKGLTSGEYELVFRSSTGNYVISKSSVWVPTMEEIRNNEWDIDSEDFATEKDVKISISKNMSMYQKNAVLT